MFIGSRGRIDIKGTNGSVKLTLVDRTLSKPRVTVYILGSETEYLLAKAKGESEPKTDVVYRWKVMTNPPNVQYIPLNEETFSEALLSVVR